MGATLAAATAAALLATAGPLPRKPEHPPPTVHVVTEISDDRVHSIVTAELQVWNAWFGLEISGEYILSEADLAKLREQAVPFFRDRNPVLINGERVRPSIDEILPPEDYAGIPSVAIHLVYPCATPPRSVDFRWDEFRETDWFERKAVPAMLKYRGVVDQATFTPAEPQYIWRPPVVAPVRPRVEAVSAPPPLHLLLPMGSIALLLAGVVMIPLGARLRVSRPLRWALLAGAVVVAFAIRDLATVRVAAPWAGVDTPSPAKAVEIFETLHGNIYRAFAANTEEEIYDLLAVSVGPELLDELYADVYESLIMRGQGGAVCVIDNIERLSQEASIVDDGGELPRFAVDAAWRVHGVVSHWGHEHRRMNEYHAVYAVQHDGRAWKIVNVEILDHKRVDEDG